MPGFSHEERADSTIASQVVDSIFGASPAAIRRPFLEFLGDSIDYVARRTNDRWGVTLFLLDIRLNVGWVECLVLSKGGMRVLLETESAPGGVRLVGRPYANAPGCRMTTLSFSARSEAFSALVESHHAALSIAAKRRTTPQIKNAHSPGVLRFLSDSLGRELPLPSYIHGSHGSDYPDEVLTPELVWEGAKKQVTVNRYERDRDARRTCIAHHGLRCAVCEMSFGERYGPFAEGLIHVHHLLRLSDIGHEYLVDPIHDLRPVCPNCHAVVHRRDPPLSIEEARDLLWNAANQGMHPADAKGAAAGDA